MASRNRPLSLRHHAERAIKHLLWIVLCWPLAAAALPHLELDVRLDPATRAFAATATLTDTQDLAGFRLDRAFELTELRVNGQATSPRRRLVGADFFALPRGTRRVELAWRATLPATAALDHRQVLQQRATTAGPDGSFLPGIAGWYPRPAELFSYQLTLHLPAGQKGLVGGNLVAEQDTASGYRARFALPHAVDSIDLMAGPYTVSERLLKLGQREVKVRTWFHAELSEYATGYLTDSARYIERYSQLIGDYPFDNFSVVSSPTPTGFGMPSLTYLGRDVIKLPFIRATSLGHEVLHNWWGNGVYPDWGSGNWSEGLTTFLADYAYKEDESAAAARAMRLGWLRDYAAVPPGEEIALKDFTTRHHGIASIFGYNKSAMVFLMLRDQIGQAAFERGLRLLWEKKRFQSASWADLEHAFATAAGRPLDAFFTQWVQRSGVPDSHRNGTRVSPGAVARPAASTDLAADPAADPDYRTWRKLDLAALPAILRDVFIAPTVGLVITDAAIDAPARALAKRVLERRASTAAANLPTLVIGLPAGVDAWLTRQGWSVRPLPVRGSAQVWAGRNPAGQPYVVVSARDAESLAALQRGLPHYGRQAWLVFEGARVSDKGVELPPAVR